MPLTAESERTLAALGPRRSEEEEKQKEGLISAVLTHPGQATASALRAVLRGNLADVPAALWRGGTGKERTTFFDVAREDLGLPAEPFLNLPDQRWIPGGIIEAFVRQVSSPAGFVGLGLSLYLDPIMWVAPLTLTKAGQLARTVGGQIPPLLKATALAKRAKIAGEAVPEEALRALRRATGVNPFAPGGVIPQANKIARSWEAEFARTGRVPGPLAGTVAAQAAEKQLALLRVQAPHLFGGGELTLIRGEPVFRAASALATELRKSPQVMQVVRLFTLYGTPKGVLDRLAASRMAGSYPGLLTVELLRRVGRRMSGMRDGFPVTNRQLADYYERVPRMTEKRLQDLSGSAALVDRSLGTAGFTLHAIDEALGAPPSAVPGPPQLLGSAGQVELAQIRQELGLAASEPLVSLIDIPPELLGTPKLHDFLARFVDDPTFLGLEIRRGGNPALGEFSVLQRWDDPGVTTAAEKPQGLYLSSGLIESPHADPGMLRRDYLGTATNPIDVSDVGATIIRRGAIDASAGVKAIRKLDEALYQRLIRMSTTDFMAEARRLLPDMDFSRHAGDRQDIMDAIGASLARDRGYDAIIHRDLGGGTTALGRTLGLKDFSEFVALRPGAISEAPGVRILLDVNPTKRLEVVSKAIRALESRIGPASRDPEFAKIQATYQELSRSIDSMASDLTQARPWRLLHYGAQGELVAGGRASGLGELLQVASDLTRGEAAVEARVVRLAERPTLQWQLRQAELPAERIALNERARLATRAEESLRSHRRAAAISIAEPAPGEAGIVNVSEKQLRETALHALYGNMDPDLTRVEALDRTLEHLASASTVKPPRGGKVLVTTPGLSNRVKREIGPGRFKDMPRTLRAAGLELERLTAMVAQYEESRGLLKSRLPAYLPHLLFEAFEDDAFGGMKRLARAFSPGAKGPLREPRLPFSRKREIDGGIIQVNDDMDREFFLQDIVTAVAVRGVASFRAVAYHDFIHGVLREFGQKTTLAQIPDDLDPRMGVYLRKGPLAFYPSQLMPDRPIKEALEAVSGVAAEQARRDMSFIAGQELTEAQALAKLGGGARQFAIEVNPRQIRSNLGISGNVEAWILPRDAADHLNRAYAMNFTPEGLEVLRKHFVAFRGFWAKWTLFPFPGFISRNVVGNLANAALGELRNVGLYGAAKKMQDGKKWEGVTALGRVVTDQDILDGMIRTGTLNAGWATTEALQGTGGVAGMAKGLRGEFTPTVEKEAEGLVGKVAARADVLFEQMKRSKLGPNPDANAITTWMMRQNSLFENNARIALFTDRILKGDSNAMAAEWVRKYLFDYDEIATADRFMRDLVVPFFIWTRKNLSLQVEMLAKHPGAFAFQLHMKRLIEAGSNPDDEFLNQWMIDAFPVRLGEDEEHRGRFEYQTMANWLPAADLMKLTNPSDVAIGMLMPWFRLPLELKANYSWYFRRKLSDYPGQHGDFMGLRLDRHSIEILTAVRVLAEFDRVLPAPDGSPLQAIKMPDFTDRLLASAFGAGMKTYSVDFEKQRRIALGQKERLLREYKIALGSASRREDRRSVEELMRLIEHEAAREPDRVLPQSPQGLPVEP